MVLWGLIKFSTVVQTARRCKFYIGICIFNGLLSDVAKLCMESLMVLELGHNKAEPISD